MRKGVSLLNCSKFLLVLTLIFFVGFVSSVATLDNCVFEKGCENDYKGVGIQISTNEL